MALLLNIDTALETASVSLAEDGKVLQGAVNESQKDHAAWLQPAIKKLFTEADYKLENINAIGVINGPGSYTGLRVGLATAKGLCYALGIPLVTISSLEVLALSAINNLNLRDEADLFICPMIDARRLEVFTALYDTRLTCIRQPQAMVLTEHSFQEELKGRKILFLGNGSTKFQAICHHPHAIFKNFPFTHFSLASLTYSNYIGNNFAELAYTEPLYLKEFFIAR
jgi:tRNA threonylcarbamoyladenosine biosynthesis protein TsaB